MTVLLHGGHAHTETAASSVSPELFALSVGFLLVGVAVLGYAIRQYTGGG
jgi:hypothetical protein